jgi:hypothetical protein
VVVAPVGTMILVDKLSVVSETEPGRIVVVAVVVGEVEWRSWLIVSVEKTVYVGDAELLNIDELSDSE